MAKHKMLGNVDLLGLNSFGQNPGMSPILGAVIGGGTAGITTLALDHYGSGTTQVNSDVIGLGVGLAAAGIMYAMPKTRHAALGAALGAFLASGLRWLERVVFGTVQLPAATAQVASQVAAGATGTTPGMSGLGIARTRALNGLGLSTTRALNGLGIATTQQRVPPVGTIPGVAGPRLTTGGGGRPPLSLLGPNSPGAAQVRLMGGPQIHGVAGHWGATHFSH